MEKVAKTVWSFFEKTVNFIIQKLLHLPVDEEKINGFLQFVKFGLVGISNTAVHYCIYLICSFIGLHYIMANFMAFTVSVLNSFYWNSRYVFHQTDGKKRSLMGTLIKTFISYGFTGLLLSSILLYIEVDMLQINALLAPVINLIVTIPLNFIINKFWAFKEK